MISRFKILTIQFITLCSSCSYNNNIENCWKIDKNRDYYLIKNFYGVVVGTDLMFIASAKCPGFRIQSVKISNQGQKRLKEIGGSENRLIPITGNVILKQEKMISNNIQAIEIISLQNIAIIPSTSDRLVELVRQRNLR